MRHQINKSYKLGFLQLWCILIACLLSGCNEKNHTIDVQSQMQESSAAVEEVAAEHIIVTYQTMQGSVITDLDQVLDDINEITIPEIGVEVEFRVINAQDSFVEYPLWLSKGECIDLMVLNYQDITTYISRGMLKPLDELFVSDGTDILSLLEEGIYITEGAVIQGSTYGVGIVSDIQGGNGMGLWVPLSLIEATGFLYEEDHIYTTEELTDFFAKCKKLYPNQYPLGQITANANYTYYGYYGESADSLGAELPTGVLSEDGQIVNFYETQEYYDFLQQMREWYLAGYLYPDAAFTDNFVFEMVSSGLLLSYPYMSIPDNTATDMFGEEAVCLRTTELRVQPQSSKGIFWTIPETSQAPKAAMRFLNMMYGDTRISNLLQYGIFGKHYIMLDEETGSIDFPHGISVQSIGYYNPLGIYGDRRNMYTFDSNEVIRKKQIYAAKSLQNKKPFRDFVYSSEAVNMELVEVQKVVDRYLPVLESGSVELEPCYKEFLMQLQMAGIDVIIADKQKQYDDWLAQKQ